MLIGFSICDPGLSFGAIVGLGAKERAAEMGVALSVESVFTPAEQAGVIERFVGESVDALIVEAVESRVVLPALHNARAAGIPVVIADMGIHDAEVACSVRSDNVKGGELAATYLAERLGGQGSIAHLQGLLTADNGIDRTRGMHNVLDRHPGIDIVFEGTSEWTREAGAELMREVLLRHPSLDAVFGGNDPLALGAIDAIEEAGRLGEILVAGFDALPDALLAVEHGTMAATVRQMPRSIGRLALEMALRVLDGEPVPPEVQTDVALVTPESVAEASLATLPLFPRVLVDLTESSAALAEERSLLRTLIDNLPDLIYVKDREGRFVLANPGLLRHVGAQAEADVLAKTDFDFFPPELAAQYQADEQAIIESGEPLISHEERSVDAQGNTRWFSTTKVLARDSHGSVVGVVGMNRDITERKRLEAQLLQAQKMETVGQLAGGIAHDFNNLLTAIGGYTDLLLEDISPSSTAHSELLEIQKAARRGAALTQQLLAFARKQILESRVVNLNDLILDIDKLLRRLIGEQIELVTRRSPDLLPVRADPGQIEQVLVNLAVNARDAMPQGGSLTIETSNVTLDEYHSGIPVSVVPGDYAVVAVRDTGIGMPAEVRTRAFEPFFTTKDVDKGTGLGLATCLGVIQQHGGYIWADSTVGRGTTLSFCLPGAEAARTESPQSAERAPDPGGTETVLLVEDDLPVRKLAARVLREHGYTVLEAGDGQEALETAERWPAEIQLLLSDVVMPRMGGVTLSERLAAQHPNLKVLYVSGYTRSAIAQEGWLEKGVALLPKPFTPGDLVRHVREALQAGASATRR